METELRFRDCQCPCLTSEGLRTYIDGFDDGCLGLGENDDRAFIHSCNCSCDPSVLSRSSYNASIFQLSCNAL